MARIFLKTRCSIKNFDKIDIRGLSTLKGQKLAATNAVWDNWNESQILDEKVEKYSVYHPTPISIAHFINFGKKETGESSFLFLKRELPVRFANIMKELMLMPDELKQTNGCRLIMREYAHSFQDLIAFEKADPKDEEVQKRFSETLVTIRDRHANTVPTMAEAVMEVKSNYATKDKNGTNGNGKLPKFGKNIQYFLDRLYTSRISLRMLINQHTLLFTDMRKYMVETEEGSSKTMIGTLDPDCEVGHVIQQAYDNAKFLCEQYYMSAPDLWYESHDATKSSKVIIPREKQIGKINLKMTGQQDPLNFVYIPSHLYHILFEIFKNAMRATIDQAGESSLHLPPVEVFAVKGKEDMTIHVRDRGGGIPRRLMGSIFEYLYTTANPVITSSHDIHDMSAMRSEPGMHTVPLAGYGYGLPLSRLYARYFGGDLEIYSDEGWGTDAVIYLHALAGSAKERLPVYNETGTKKIYEAQLTASDWTGASPVHEHRKMR